MFGCPSKPPFCSLAAPVVRFRGKLPLCREDFPYLWARLKYGDEIRFDIVRSPHVADRLCVGGRVELLPDGADFDDDDHRQWPSTFHHQTRSHKMRGRITNLQHAFAFLKPDDGGPDTFLHMRALPPGMDWRDVCVGDEFEWDVVPSTKDATKVCAGNVRSLR
jgi:cold shock CspA family protein